MPTTTNRVVAAEPTIDTPAGHGMTFDHQVDGAWAYHYPAYGSGDVARRLLNQIDLTGREF